MTFSALFGESGMREAAGHLCDHYFCDAAADSNPTMVAGPRQPSSAGEIKRLQLRGDAQTLSQITKNNRALQ